MDLTRAQAILTVTVRELYENSQKPILGSQLKPAVVQRASREGETFDESSLGYKGFLAFVSDCPQVAVTPRASGVDFLAVPTEQLGALPSNRPSPIEIVRDDFWKAFTVFQRPGERRVYDRIHDLILTEDDRKPQGPNTLITPISKEQQLTWRKEFVGTIQDNTQPGLLSALEARDPFREFNALLGRNPRQFKAWHSFKVQKVRGIIQAWADLNRIPNETWLVAPKPKLKPQSRADLYALLDKLPTERLLDIQIPIGWILEMQNKNTRNSQK